MIRPRVAPFAKAGLVLAASLGAAIAGASWGDPPGPPAIPSVPVPASSAGTPGLLRLDRREELAGSTSVRIVNPFGDVRIRDGGPGTTVGIHAVVQNLHPPRALRIVSERAGGELVLRVVADGADPGDGPADRADLAVHVPRGAALAVETTSGLIEVRGFRGDLDLSTSTGQIDLRGVSAKLSARSDSGAISAVLANTPPGVPRTLESVTGALTVLLPADADAEVTGATSGDVTTDVSVEIRRSPHEEPSKLVRSRLGAGRGSVSLRSRRGDVRIRLAPEFHDTPASSTAPSTR